MKRILISVSLLAVGAGVVLVGCRATRAGYESAPYQVVRSVGRYEIRDYPTLTVAETTMAQANREADGSFNRLFGFITGRNEAQAKIAMTTPVLMSGAETNRTMAFVLPAKMAADSAPRPADGAVTLKERAAGRFAVLRYRGGRTAEMEQATLEQLKAWMGTQGLPVLSSPTYGYFDPPWTPPFLRRNEVMLRTQISP